MEGSLHMNLSFGPTYFILQGQCIDIIYMFYKSEWIKCYFLPDQK